MRSPANFLAPEPLADEGMTTDNFNRDDLRCDEELLFHVELWDETGARVERELARARTAIIGYGAYFAAAKDFPHRIITLRRKNRELSRWSVRS